MPFKMYAQVIGSEKTLENIIRRQIKVATQWFFEINEIVNDASRCPHLVNCFEHLSHLCSVTWLLSVCFRRVWSFKFDFLLKVASHREHVRRFLGVKVDLDFAWQIALKFQNFIQEVDKFLIIDKIEKKIFEFW